MKQLAGVAHNRLGESTEVVLVLVEPAWTIASEGGLARHESSEAVRFFTNRHGLVALANQLIGMANDDDKEGGDEK